MRFKSSAEMLEELRAKNLAEGAKAIKVAEVSRLRDLKESARDQLMIDPRIILVDDNFNPRNYDLPENRAHLDELKHSIATQGVLIPLLVRYDAESKSVIVIDGECRLRATLELIAEGHDELLTVPTIQVPGGTEQDRLLTSILANTGKSLSKWELGTAFQRLYKFGWSPEQIATKTGYAARFIGEAMELADAPAEVKQLLSSQAVTPSLALAELRANGAAAVQTLQAKASAAKASGKKGPAKRDIAAPKRTPAAAPTSAPSIVAVIQAIYEDVTAEDLACEENEYLSIKRGTLVSLVSFLPPVAGK